MQVLVVEDDHRISSFLIKGLEENGFLVTLCRNAEDALLEENLKVDWDVIVLDIMLPGIDGVQLLQTLRYKQVYAPVLMLSALNSIQDKVTSLDYGADDYLTKPFHFEELLSRINALSRRKQYQMQDKPKNPILEFDELQIDTDQYKVYLKGELVDLSPREFKLLMYLIENRNKTVSRMQILNAVWGITFNNHSNVVDVYISYLRNKVESQDQKFIQTVKGIGYMFKYDS
ncbi:DNA-binding response regulator [Sphingobacterium mizutaii NBRC 14946 = DSM 11724]|uniref:Transcriptional regulatory protein tcrA n=2 Tax=Sphingobacterium mizutaii TaxID=1010 RepID=A0AAJ5C079_9SPHI|nr:response regulator transcription factor [Sphingobacterium mizutaii]GEM69645.1 DNA-binding response regulator [Sphingobacterium mizutaii NBRC 14946 = DSM 11724]SDK98975.1 DNA-binding response regulator, OmpR family, contains REC and winged-helix (wHTH) domain [Sphingobacterium mizutaii]SNV49582.1 Transcriptional regulatory protein tcrA [Sphingobacterium mizutaii]